MCLSGRRPVDAHGDLHGSDPPPASGGGVPKKNARRLQLGVKTVRRAVDWPTPPVRASPPRLSSLAPWLVQIEQWLRDHRQLTAKRIRRLLLLASAVSPRTVRRYVAALRRSVTSKEAFVHRAWLQARRWRSTSAQSWVDIAGTLCKVKYLAALPLLERKHRAVAEATALMDWRLAPGVAAGASRTGQAHAQARAGVGPDAAADGDAPGRECRVCSDDRVRASVAAPEDGTAHSPTAAGRSAAGVPAGVRGGAGTGADHRAGSDAGGLGGAVEGSW